MIFEYSLYPWRGGKSENYDEKIVEGENIYRINFYDLYVGQKVRLQERTLYRYHLMPHPRWNFAEVTKNSSHLPIIMG